MYLNACFCSLSGLSSLAFHAVAFRVFHFHFHPILDTSSGPGPFLSPPNQPRLTLYQPRSRSHFAFFSPSDSPSLPRHTDCPIIHHKPTLKVHHPVPSRFNPTHVHTPLPPRIASSPKGTENRREIHFRIFSRKQHRKKQREKERPRIEEKETITSQGTTAARLFFHSSSHPSPCPIDASQLHRPPSGPTIHSSSPLASFIIFLCSCMCLRLRPSSLHIITQGSDSGSLVLVKELGEKAQADGTLFLSSSWQ
ncbi:uncharacterized protein LY79DRAFT_101193 [Colletotrichum navitas]|uniref:Uncharacterized protein n=1 Tax=Colletotrichum navitas TaxID=681940 RepID=A0AAD8V8B8_9PEZI|nr:uncharacterized protein LY79DRAFT_101193 [Colletotrichum navitas]KAK1595536.1 hypothetical protein LY79DRAFT_101193 [Colletotrichum navitas]